MPLAILGGTTVAHVYPWWGSYFLDNPLRRLIHAPEKIIGPYVRPGMTVMDVGCGMGLFSMPMARIVGNQGRVIAVDLQQEMFDVLRRAEQAGVAVLVSPASAIMAASSPPRRLLRRIR